MQTLFKVWRLKEVLLGGKKSTVRSLKGPTRGRNTYAEREIALAARTFALPETKKGNSYEVLYATGEENICSSYKGEQERSGQTMTKECKNTDRRGWY